MDSLFKTKNGKVILSVLWGLGIAALFYKVCEHSGCFVIKEHSNPQVEHSIYEFQGECFNGNGGEGCGSSYVDPGPQRYPPKCDQPLFNSHPPIDYYESRVGKNCGDPRHCKSPSCYKFNPMDSIFRAPSSQIVYPYH